MRTALVSEVHGNPVALEAGLADLERDPVDQFVALGDMAQGGPQPASVIDRVLELGWPVVLGNADAFLLDPDDDFLLHGTPEGVFRELLGGAGASVLAGGHVHLQFLRRVGDRVFVDPGSVGLAQDHEQDGDLCRADPWAAYAVVETHQGGGIEIAFRRVPFDPGEAAAVTLAGGMPYAEQTAVRWQPL